MTNKEVAEFYAAQDPDANATFILVDGGSGVATEHGFSLPGTFDDEAEEMPDGAENALQAYERW